MPPALPAIVYARISRDPGNNRDGVERQVRARLKAIEDDPDRELVTVPGSPLDRRRPAGARWPDGVLVDNDISAAARRGKVAHRPEYERAVALLTSGRARVISAKSVERIWRSPLEYHQAMPAIEGRGVIVDTRSGSHDLSSAGGRFIPAMLAELGALEVEQTRERELDAFADYAAAGAAHGRAPFGYRVMHRQPDGGMHAPAPSESGACPRCEGRKPGRWRTLAVNEDEADALRNAAGMVLAGKSLYSVLRVLDEGGTPTRAGKPWRVAGITSLRLVLINPVYTGQRAHSPGWDGRGHRPAATVLYAAGWPVILDAATHEKLVALLTDPARNVNTWAGRAEPRHLLTGVVRCGRCGGPMFVQQNRNRPRWTCTNIPGEWGHVVRKAGDVEDEAERVILRWMSDGGLYDRARAAAEDEDVQATRAGLSAAVAERDHMVSIGAVAGWTVAEAESKLAPVLARIGALRAAVAASASYDALAEVGERGGSFAAAWEGWDLPRRRAAVAALISRVVIYPAPGRGGQTADPRFIRVYPAGWAAGLSDAEPASAPEPATSRDIVRAYLAGHPGADPAGIAVAAGLPVHTVRVALGKLVTAGLAEREWLTRPGRGASGYAYRLAA